LISLAARWYKLRRSDQALLIQALLLLGMIRLALLIIPFRYLAGYLGERQSSAGTSSDRHYVHQVRWAIATVSRHAPWESKCLAQAIAAKILLRRRRLPNTLYLGVAKTGPDNMIAHAWLLSEDDMVTGGDSNTGYTVVARFGDLAKETG